MAVLSHASNTPHFFRIHHHQEKRVVGYFPFTRDAERSGGPEPESGVVVRVPDDDYEWTACVFELPVSGLDESAANAMALMFGKTDRDPSRHL